jgi:hypothetical protein
MNADPSPSIAPRKDRRESSAGTAGRGRSGDSICSSAVRAHTERGFGGLPLPWPSGHMRNWKMDNIRNDHQAHRRCLAFLIRWVQSMKRALSSRATPLLPARSGAARRESGSPDRASPQKAKEARRNLCGQAQPLRSHDSGRSSSVRGVNLGVRLQCREHQAGRVIITTQPRGLAPLSFAGGSDDGQW